jgi:hypothetical protein
MGGSSGVSVTAMEASGTQPNPGAARMVEWVAMSVHLPGDDFGRYLVSGAVDPWLPDAAHQHEVVGGAIAAAAFQFAEGGYTVLLDGQTLPEGIVGLAEVWQSRGVPLHYVILRADLATCLRRAKAPGPVPNDRLLAELHARFADLGRHEPNVIDAGGTPDGVVAAVRAGLASGRFRCA